MELVTRRLVTPADCPVGGDHGLRLATKIPLKAATSKRGRRIASGCCILAQGIIGGPSFAEKSDFL
jgi:hypothetical protein